MVTIDNKYRLFMQFNIPIEIHKLCSISVTKY